MHLYIMHQTYWTPQGRLIYLLKGLGESGREYRGGFIWGDEPG